MQSSRQSCFPVATTVYLLAICKGASTAVAAMCCNFHSIRLVAKAQPRQEFRGTTVFSRGAESAFVQAQLLFRKYCTTFSLVLRGRMIQRLWTQSTSWSESLVSNRRWRTCRLQTLDSMSLDGKREVTKQGSRAWRRSRRSWQKCFMSSSEQERTDALLENRHAWRAFYHRQEL